MLEIQNTFCEIIDTNQFYDPFEREERDLSIENIENMRELYVLNFLSKEIIIKNSHKFSNLKALKFCSQQAKKV